MERFHQTEKKWLAKQPGATSIAELQSQLDAFAGYHNEVRPHRAIGRATPAEAFAARPNAAPRLHHIGLGRRLAGTWVLVLVAGLGLVHAAGSR